MDISMVDLNKFDMIIGSIIIILGIKGLMNGFIKEFFGLVGLIGGVYIASRTADQVGNIIDQQLFHLNNPAAMKLFGFITVLASVWAISVIVGSIFMRLTKVSGFGFFDRLFGFVFGGGKYFLIFALIVTSLSNVTLVRDNLQHYVDDSQLYPYLKKSGSFLINIEPDIFIKPTVDIDTNSSERISSSPLPSSLDITTDTNLTTN